MKKPEQEDRFYTTPIQRTFWKTERKLCRDGYDSYEREDRTQVPPEEATLVSSLLRTGEHAPCIDIDLPCSLIPSSTPGHFHLYIDHPIPWSKYKKLLKALADAGIVEEGYVRASIKRGGTDLRLPHIKKEK